MPTKRGGIPTCYASCSIGHKPEHNLPAKLKAISEAGFDAIELSMPDLLSFANEKLKKEVGPKDFDDLCQVGPEVKKLCQEHGLKILILQPFANFEGWKKGSVEARDAMERAEGWMRIMESVGTDMLQVREAKCEFRAPPLSALARLTKWDPGRIV
jgi:sugar phosphate isomerase/epimerase